MLNPSVNATSTSNQTDRTTRIIVVTVDVDRGRGNQARENGGSNGYGDGEQKSNSQKKKKKCFLCDSEDHLLQQCPEKKRSTKQNGKVRFNGRRVEKSDSENTGSEDEFEMYASNRVSEIEDSQDDLPVYSLNRAFDTVARSVSSKPDMMDSLNRAIDVVARRTSTDFNAWCIDSGATANCTGNKKLFVDFWPYKAKLKTGGGDMWITGAGTVRFKLPNGKSVLLNHVLYVPDIKENLLSTEYLIEHGIGSINDPGEGFSFYNVGNRDLSIATGRKNNRSIYLDDVATEKSLFIDHSSSYLSRRMFAARYDENDHDLKELHHRRLGHPGRHRFNDCMHHMGLEIREDTQKEGCDCIICIKAKQSKQQNHKAVPRAEKPLQRVYMDVWGPYRKQNLMMISITLLWLTIVHGIRGCILSLITSLKRLSVLLIHGLAWLNGSQDRS